MVVRSSRITPKKKGWLAYHAGRDGRPFESDHPDCKKGQKISPLLFSTDMYVTYILYSNKLKKFYVGQTKDLSRRLVDHNRGKTPFTAGGIPWVLVFSKEFISRSEAMRLEKQIKKRGASRYLNDNRI
jgi:putative endonuclease